MGCSFHTESSTTLPLHRNTPETKEKVTILIGRSSSEKENRFYDQDEKYENIIEVKEPINGEGLILVERAISKHFLFYCLNQTERYELIKLMRRYSTGKDQIIFKKGDKASNFFIISSGRVLVETEIKPKILEKGSCFGELALIYDAPRSATIVSLESTVMWGIEAEIFEKFMSRIKQKNSKNIKKFIDKLPFFAFMNELQKESLGYTSHRFRYTMGSLIFSVKDPANSIFVVISGRIEMEIPNKPKVLFEKGEMFGEGSLLGDEFRSGTACAIEDTEVLSISKNSLLHELRIETDNIIFYCICKWSLKRSPIFNLLKRTIIDKLIFRGEMFEAEDNEILEKQGTKTNCLYICLQGKINGCPVGSIFNEHPEQSGKKDLVKMSKGYVFRIGFGELAEIINRPLGEFVQTKEKNCGREVIEDKDPKEGSKRQEIH